MDTSKIDNWRTTKRRNQSENTRTTSNPKRRFKNSESKNEMKLMKNQNEASNKSKMHRDNIPRTMGFKKITELLQNDDLEEVVFLLSDKRNSFKELLMSKQSPDLLVLTVKLLRKICDCPFNANKTMLLSQMINSGFMDNVSQFVATLVLQNERDKKFNDFFWKNTDEFWMNILGLVKETFTLLKVSSFESNQKVLKAIKLNLPLLEDTFKMNVSDDIKNEINSIYEEIEKTAKTISYKNEFEPYRNSEMMMDPPDNFREIPVYPSAVELINDIQPFLRRNVVKGPYLDVEHYLDVQFRLLREDFVQPLRQGICRYIKDKKSKLENIRIYRDVVFLGMEQVNDQKCFLIQFTSKKQKIDKDFYKRSKMFMLGSLLCFTDDNFNSIFFGKVVERKFEQLEKGQIVIGFNSNFVTPANLLVSKFLMVESKVFFEPYYQVLKGLKEMRTENFPMKSYIIDVNTDTKPPDYLIKIDPVFYKIKDELLFPLDITNAKFDYLNEAQNEAFKAALTREFTIIQGPPGTGKTFLGLEIAKVLLKNNEAWYNKSPILVICYTNHALDQFLEGLVSTTNNIIRIGGGSKSEVLKKFNIRNKMDFHNSSNTKSVIYQNKTKMDHQLNIINTVNKYLNEIEKYTGIVDFKVFSDIVKGFQDSWFYNATDSEIINWLVTYNRSRTNTKQANNNEGNEATILQENAQITNEYDDFLEEGELDEYGDLVENIPPLKKLLDLETHSEQINTLITNLDYLKYNDGLTYLEKKFEENKILTKLYIFENEYQELKFRMEEHRQNNYRVACPNFIDMKRPHSMPMNSRWKLYFYWLSLYQNHLRKQKENAIRSYRSIYKVYNSFRVIEETQVMKEALIIGMTTTCAARYQASLLTLKNPIVIVEEAAEILEAHIIAALTPSCKHLILIGDHQQLKPATANFTIETKYLLGVSLFERMVHNNIQCYTLNVQHRMRPEIANLIRPTIYPVLKDHETVLKRDHIKGVEHDLYFIDHTEEEEQCQDDSKKNTHEAAFFIKYARHLILNGYKSHQIVIIVAYLGQMFEMKKEMRNHEDILKDVRIAVLDNYQGEESDIVLLSLVRNNKDNKIGFLKIENRICVALSRARNGLFIMGNMKQLVANSDIWFQINETLRHQRAIGPYLTLRCQIHKKLTNVSKAVDFLNIPEGGCDLICNEKLNCGHTCTSLCHTSNRNHENYQCRQICNKILCENPEHKCLKFCYQVCGPCDYLVKQELNCGHTAEIMCHLDPEKVKCVVLLNTKLPCGHDAEKPCFEDLNTFKCPYPCDSRIEPCGHACVNTCHIAVDPDHLKYICMKPCENINKGCTSDEPHKCQLMCWQNCKECFEEVKKLRKCGHMYTVACHASPDDIICEKPCKKVLSCGHPCKKKCNECCGPCRIQVDKIIPECKHKIKMVCSEEPSKNLCSGECPLFLSCGHKCMEKCKDICTQKCKVYVECSILSPCGHIVTKLPCYIKTNHTDDQLVKYCSEECNAELHCKHKCSGTCGKCYQGRFHQRCQEKCGIPLVCNHECPIPCREACRPCERPCEYRCKHSKCKKKCGDPCTRCKEKCLRKCEHQKCTRLCGDYCSVDPCTEPCQKLIKKCKHKCVGFCGDPCPKLCGICDKEKLRELFFGTEEDEDARFVLLEDCGHVMESSGMDLWLNQTNEEEGRIKIKPLVCPKCSTIIKKTVRYSDYVKQVVNDLKNVKVRFYGNPHEIEDVRNKLQKELSLVHIEKKDEDINDFINKITSRLEYTKNNRRQNINIMELKAIEIKLNIFKEMVNYKAKEKLTKDVYSRKELKFLLKLLSKNIDSITQQEINDLYLEIDRLKWMIDLDRINYQPYMVKENVKNKVEEVVAILTRNSKFDKSENGLIETLLKEIIKETSSPIVLSDKERQEIVKAMSLKKGHWYKCPNGHPYVITECGGAMQQSRCYDCNAEIGGSNHRLLSSNQVATEMDGATSAAWSEAANMNNYEL